MVAPSLHKAFARKRHQCIAWKRHSVCSLGPSSGHGSAWRRHSCFADGNGSAWTRQSWLHPGHGSACTRQQLPLLVEAERTGWPAVVCLAQWVLGAGGKLLGGSYRCKFTTNLSRNSCSHPRSNCGPSPIVKKEYAPLLAPVNHLHGSF